MIHGPYNIKLGKNIVESTSEKGRTIPNIKSEFIIRDNAKGRCLLTDTAFSGDRNVIKMEAKKILQYKYPTIEIQLMWNVKTKVMSLITGATGNISK